MFKLGQRVKFVRNKGGEIVQGEGAIVAFSLDHTRREVATIKRGNDIFNVDISALEPSPEYVAQFTAMCAEVERLVDEGNKKAQDTHQAVIADYNNQVETVQSPILAPVIEIDERPEDTEDDEQPGADETNA